MLVTVCPWAPAVSTESILESSFAAAIERLLERSASVLRLQQPSRRSILCWPLSCQTSWHDHQLEHLIRNCFAWTQTISGPQILLHLVQLGTRLCVLQCDEYQSTSLVSGRVVLETLTGLCGLCRGWSVFCVVASLCYAQS